MPSVSEIQARVSADNTDFKRKMAESESVAVRSSKAIAGAFSGIASALAGIASVGVFVSLGRGAIKLAGDLADTAGQVGVNVEKLQVLTAVARESGVEHEAVAKALVKVRTAAQEALEGSSGLADNFSKLGINLREFMALPAEARLVAIARGYTNASDKGAAFNAVAGIFGEKVGPRMMNVLTELSSQGFPKLEEQARAAGQVMSAETIAALDKAGDAIDAFKQRITIAVGNVLVNFRTEEGIKLMGLQLLRAVAPLGTKIIDAFSETGKFAYAFYTGLFTGIANGFRDKLLTGFAAVATVINKALPEKLQINIAGITELKSAGLSIGDTIRKALNETTPSNFTAEVKAFWDTAVAEQQKVVDALNKVDLGKDAKALTDAGKTLVDSGKQTGAAIEDAARRAAKALLDAANAAIAASHQAQISGSFIAKLVTSGLSSEQLAQASDSALREQMRRNNQGLSQLKTQAGGAFDGGNAYGLANTFSQARLTNENSRIGQELQFRDQLRGNVNVLGVEGARKRFQGDPIKFDDAVQRYVDGKIDKQADVQRETLSELKKLNDQFRKGTATVLNIGARTA